MDALVVTCEHGGSRIPVAYRALFQGQKRLLASHRGRDLGALAMARSLATALDAPVFASTISRLLIDLNRPTGHPQLFSTVTRNLPVDLRARIFEQYHEPFWSDLKQFVERAVAEGRRTVHISSHSFTPRLEGQLRRADVGLLYDPARPGEAELCSRWRAALIERDPTLHVRRNYPYRGKAAGLTAQMRRWFSARDYVGVELEVNQRFFLVGGRRWSALREVVAESLLATCDVRELHGRAFAK